MKPLVHPVTVPQPFHLATGNRAKPPQYMKGQNTNDDGNHEKLASNNFKFGEAFVTSLKKKPPAHPVTVPQPFHLAMGDRAQSPQRMKGKNIHEYENNAKVGSESNISSEGFVFHARPVPDFSQPALISSQKMCPACPVTVPQPFHLATSQRPSSKLLVQCACVDAHAIDNNMINEKYVLCSLHANTFSRNPNCQGKHHLGY
jgi:hypothetical protein